MNDLLPVWQHVEAAAEAIPGAIGLSGSTVSRGFIEAARRSSANSRSGT